MKEYTVIKAKVFLFKYHITGPPTPDIDHTMEAVIVLEDGYWYPLGCETWEISNDEFFRWIESYVILSLPILEWNNEYFLKN